MTLVEAVPNASAPISAAFDGSTLWVLYMGAAPGRELGSPTLLTVRDLGPRPRVVSQMLPDGNVGYRSALGRYRDGVAGVITHTNPIVFVMDARGECRSAVLDAAQAGYGGSIAVLDDRALVSFDENGTGVHHTVIDLAAMRPGPMRAIRGDVQGSVATAAFGGLVAFSDFSAGAGVVRCTRAGGGDAVIPRALAGSPGVLYAATGNADRMYVVHGVRTEASGPLPTWVVKLATLTDPEGNGVRVELGRSGLVPDASAAVIDSGAIAAFIDDRGAVLAAAVSSRGALLEAPVAVSPSGERARGAAIATCGDCAYVLWVQIGRRALRAARLDYVPRAPAQRAPDLASEIDLNSPPSEMASAGEDPLTNLRVNLLNRKLFELLDRHDFAAAVETGEKLLALIEHTFGPSSKHAAVACNNLASACSGMGMWQRAEELLLRAIGIHERVHGPRHPEVAVNIGGLGELYRELGQFAKAIDCNTRALEIFEAALGPSHPRVATALNNLSQAYFFQGDFVQAEPLLVRAIAISRAAGDRGALARELKNLGDVLALRGQHSDAAASYREAGELFEDILGPEHPLVAVALLGNADMLIAQTGVIPFPEHRVEGYQTARDMLRRCRDIFETAHGPDHPGVAMVDGRLANLAAQMGHPRDAIALSAAAVAALERTRGPGNLDTLRELSNLASHHAAIGQVDDSERLYREVITRGEQAFGPQSRLVMIALHNLSIVLLGAGRISDAIAYARRASKLEDNVLEQVLRSAPDSARRAFLSSINGRLSMLLSLHIDHAPRDPGALRLAFDALLRRKGRALEASADMMRQLRASLSPGVRGTLDRYRELTGKIASLALTNHPVSAELTAQLAAAEQELAAESAAFRRAVAPPSIDAIAGVLGPDEALVEYVLSIPLRDAGRGQAIEELWDLSRARYAAYVLLGRGDLGFVELGSAEIIDDLVLRFRHAIAVRAPTERRLARQLHDEIMQPVHALLDGCRALHLAPDGPLHLVPFAALRDPKDELLIDRYQLNHVDSGRDLARFGAAERPRQESVVVANPAFGEAPGAAAFPALSGTAREAEIVSGVLPRARVLTGADATKPALEAVRGPRVLHLATHAYFRPPDEDASRLDRDAAAMRALLQSGLALAGANQDGTHRLTAQEILAMDLVGTRLVVLSACETGVGDIQIGDGVYGLRRAFSIAGAESQLVSLWRVDDTATAELMADYYRALAAGAPRNAALRSAQRAMRARPDRAAARYWAAFISVGDPAPLLLDEPLAAPP